MLGWIGNVFIVLGLWGIGNRRRGAFLFSVVGELFWIAAAVGRGQFDLAVICVVFAVLALRSYVKWAPAEEPTRWVRETVTLPWFGKHGGESVTVRLGFTDGRREEIIFSNPSVTKAFADALNRVLGTLNWRPVDRYYDCGCRVVGAVGSPGCDDCTEPGLR